MIMPEPPWRPKGVVTVGVSAYTGTVVLNVDLTSHQSTIINTLGLDALIAILQVF